MTTAEEVEEYLIEVRRLVDDALVVIVPRVINLEGMALLNVTQKAALGIVKSLTHKSYSSGPEVDRDRPSQQCWIFGSDTGCGQAYIKLVVEQLPENRARLKILSFHPAAYALGFPLA